MSEQRSVVQSSYKRAGSIPTLGIFDDLDFERAVEAARRLNRYEFLFMAAPIGIEHGMGSPLNLRRFVSSMLLADRRADRQSLGGSRGHTVLITVA